MIREPPGEPTTSTGAPSRVTMVGAIEERGRLPGSTRFAIGMPSAWVSKLKSVSSLLSRNPPGASTREPNPFSIVVVIESALPAASTIEMCEVDGSSIERSSASSIAWSQGGEPALTSGRLSSPERRPDRSVM